MSIERRPIDGEMSISKAVAVEGPGRWVFLSGHVGVGEDGAIVSGGVRSEALTTFDHLLRALSELGGTRRDVVRITAYLTSLDEYPAFDAARKEVFGETLPASTAVQVAGLLGLAQVEIDAVAFVPL